MKIIYIYRKWDYAAILAAYLHLKGNPPHKTENYTLEIMKPYYIGLDEKGREIYLLKYKAKKEILVNILYGLGDIFNEEIKIIDLCKFDGILPRFLGCKTNFRKALEDFIYENNL